MKPYVEHVFKIYAPEGDGACLEVGPDADGLDMIQVSTITKNSKEWFGELRFAMDKNTAKALGEVLIKAANEVQE